MATEFAVIPLFISYLRDLRISVRHRICFVLAPVTSGPFDPSL